MGSGYRGQIAIDDTAIIPGDCPTQPDYTGDLGILWPKVILRQNLLIIFHI